MKTKSFFYLIGMLFAVLLLSACGTSAPAPTAVSVAPTATNVPPTDTPIPPTATSVPPTATAVPTNTPTNTPVPPTATATAIPPTATATATLRPTIPLPTATPLALITVDWLGIMGYEGRDGDERWCQMQMIFHNKSAQDLKWPDYQPVFVIVDGSGNVVHRYKAGYYSKKLGWQNGIDGDPPTIPANSDSYIWTWYSVSANRSETCRFVYVQVGGRLYAAEYNTNGDLVNKNATLPR